MKHSYALRFIPKTLVFLLAFVCLSLISRANHIVGADLFYTHISGNTYKITFIAYGDCGPASAMPFAQLPFARPRICVYDGGTSIASVNLSIDTPSTPLYGDEITPVCPADSDRTQCTNPSYTTPGIKKFVYTGTYTVPYTSHNWRFIFTGSMGATSAGRAAAITNIATGSVIQLIDSLDNTWFNNSSPLLTVVPTPFFCLNTPNTYNPGAVDADGDSLHFSLVPGADGPMVCSRIGGSVTYTGGYSATSPLGVSAGTFSFGSTSGTLGFTPNITQRSLVVYNIKEYRNDTFAGTSQREMTFLVITCTNTPPTGSFTGGTGGTVVDSATFASCVGAGSFSAVITATQADTTHEIYVTYSGLPTGATFTTVNDSTNKPVSTFRWSTTGVPAGTYRFFVTYTDNNCPLAGQRTNAYSIVIADPPTVDAGANVSVCEGASTTLTATGATTYSWSPSSGLSCSTCASTSVTPLATGIYTVIGISRFNCSDTDTVRVTVNPNPGPITGTNEVCSGFSTTLSDTTAGGRWGTASAAIASVNTTGVVTGVAAGTTLISYTIIATGCFDTISYLVNQSPSAISGPSSVCVDASISLGNVYAGGVWTSSDASIASVNSGTGSVTGVSAGTVDITYTMPGNCFVVKTITVNPNPAGIVGAGTICAGDRLNLSDATSGGAWSSAATGIATVSATGVVTGVSGGTVVISYTLPTTCFDTALVLVNPTPTIAGPTAVCVASSITLTPSLAGGSWSTSDGTIASVASTGDVYGLTTGTVSITYMMATGCFGIKSITVNPLPAAIGGPTTVCERATITLTNSSTGGSWSSSATATATVNPSTGVVTGVRAGTVTITYTLPTTCYAVTTVTVNPLPVSGTISGPTSVCVGATISLSASVGSGTWSTSNALATVSTSGTVYGVSAGTDTVYYSVTNSCGTARSAYVVTIIALPVAGTLSGPSSVCVDATISLTASLSGGTWSSSAAAVASVASGTVYGVSAGTAFISYTITNICGSASTRQSVTVLALPTISITPSAPGYCIGGNTTVTASGAVSYTWAPGTSISATTGASVNVNPTATTLYTATGIGSNGCVNSGTVLVTVYPLPTIVAPDVTICRGFSGVVSASGAATYVWSPTATLSSGVGAAVTASPTDTTTYTVVGTDAFGCVNSTTVTVNVNKIPPPPNVVSPVEYCRGVSASPLTALGSSLLWYTTATSGTGVAAPPTPVTTAAGRTTYFVTQTVDGCESPFASLAVDVFENAIADFDYKIFYGCTRDTVEFINRSQFSSGYRWTFGDEMSTTSSASDPVHFYRTVYVPTDYNVKLVGTSARCFDDSITKRITLQPTPDLFDLTNVTASQTIAFGGKVQLNAWGGRIYVWTPNDGTLSDPNINNPVASPIDSTTYTVYAYNDDGCYDSAKVHVNVQHSDDDVVVTAFTPNGDGKNDVFRIVNTKFSKLVQFAVYNRWGELVFETADITQGWDGTFRGEPQDMGVYQYMVILAGSNGTNRTFKGNVTLIR